MQNQSGKKLIQDDEIDLTQLIIDLGLESEDEQIVKNKIYVGNIPYKLTEEHLALIFGKVGKVLDSLVVGRGGRKSLGFGFVTFKFKSSVLKAITKLNGKKICGRRIIVEKARKQEIKPYTKKVKKVNNSPQQQNKKETKKSKPKKKVTSAKKGSTKNQKKTDKAPSSKFIAFFICSF